MAKNITGNHDGEKNGSAMNLIVFPAEAKLPEKH